MRQYQKRFDASWFKIWRTSMLKWHLKHVCLNLIKYQRKVRCFLGTASNTMAQDLRFNK